MITKIISHTDWYSVVDCILNDQIYRVVYSPGDQIKPKHIVVYVLNEYHQPRHNKLDCYKCFDITPDMMNGVVPTNKTLSMVVNGLITKGL